MRKIIIALMVVLTACMLGGCSQTIDANVSTIFIEKKGHVSGVVVEDFSQSYYDQAQLQEMIADEVNDYNAFAGEESVTVERISVENNVAKLIMKYKNWQDYKTFNEVELFVGTIEEAIEAGYTMKVTLKDSKDEAKEIGEQELINMQDKKIVISDESLHIKVYGKVKYMSSGATLTDSQEADTYNVDGLSYIVF